MSPHRKQQLAERIADLDVHFLSSGRAYVRNQSGSSYTVDGDSCECPDFAKRNGGTYDGRCKHVWAVRLSEPCPACNETMKYTSQPNGYKGFDCPRCGNAKMASVVLAERKARQTAA